MNKVATTYWDKNIVVSTPRRVSRSKNRQRQRVSETPQWFVFVVIALITFMLCLTVNLRAFIELRQENFLNQSLVSEVDQLTAENSTLQLEVMSLKTDSDTIEREARKLGLGRPNEKIFVPTN